MLVTSKIIALAILTLFNHDPILVGSTLPTRYNLAKAQKRKEFMIC